MSRVLLIDDRPRSRILLHRGQIVFPVRDAELRRRCEALALDAGASVRSVRGEPVEFNPVTRRKGTKGVVGYVSEDVKPIAELYAHLTQRAVAFLGTDGQCSAASPSHPIEIVVALTNGLTPLLFDLLFDASVECVERDTNERRAPGLICAASIEALAHRALLTAAALHVGPPLAPSSMEVGLEGVSAAAASMRTETGKTVDRSDVRRALQAGASLISLRTHCDGVDALLLTDLTLCPRQLPSPPTDSATGPYCAATGFCHRQGMPVSDAEREGRLLGPDAISARVLLFSTCQGALPVNPVFSREWTLIDGFLNSLGVIGLVTTWESSMPPVRAVAVTADRLRQGQAVGGVVAQFNRSRVAKLFGCRLALFGDPRLTAAPPAHHARMPHNTNVRVDNRTVRSRLADATFLRAYLTVSLTDLPPRSAAARQAALQAVLKYEYHLWRGAPVEDQPNAPGQELRAAILAFMAGRGSSPYHAWMALASDASEEYGPACSRCGERTRVTMADLRLAPRYLRELVRCPICGLIGEGPAALKTCLVVEGNCVTLSGEVPERHWAALLHIACQREEESVAFPWPADTDGRPPALTIPLDAVPAGPLRVAAVLLEEATLSVLSVPVRKLTH
jgi:hypothetical protein